ncbi:hypothetical protein LAZ67_X003717 [Cordylochernes scorpioides]|uniref:Uncharacterized protein n=1 Tax=Cordylochernes scorpioides TaxID=51811 RepID=A0ABY6LUD1_9ARAC|nr:hypothetical protein LAZ67_X003717 [Cordylochernes scorpioides]
MLKKFNEGKSKAVFNIITGDETCIYNFDPETKLQSTLWCSSKSPPPKKIRRAQNRKTVNSDWYTTKFLPAVFEKINRSRPRAQLRGVLRHDNARLHTLAQTLDFLAKSGVQLVTHSPYSPDLAPCDFFYFQKLMQEVLKLKKHIKTLEEKNAYYQNLLRKAGISTEEVWDENLHRCPQKPTLDQASALLKRLENGGLPNGLSRSKKTHVQQTSQQLAQSHHVQQNQQSAQQVVQHQLPGQQQRAVQHQPFGQHRVLQTQTQPAQLNVQQQLPSQSHQTIFSTKKVDRSRPTPEPAEVIIEQGTLSSMATGTTTVMTQALPQIPVMSTNPAAPPPIQMTAGGSGPSLIVINDNGIPILHNVVTFQNSPIILNSASSSPLLAPAATNFSDSSPCVSKDMGPPPQRIASAPSVPTTGPSEVIIRPQSADTMKQVPGSSSSTITFSSTPLQPLLSPATHVLPTAAPADSARMQLVTGGMIGFNQQQGSLYSTGPPTLPTALILPNGQIIPVVSQPSLMYPNLTWTNKISSLVKPPPPLPPQLPITRPAAPISEINCPKNIAKKIQMQKKIPASTELSALPEADRLAKLVAASNTTTNTTASLTEGEICKNKVPLRNIKSAPAPKKCTINIKPQPSTTKITTSVNSSQSSAAPPVSSTEIQKSIDSLPPPLIEPELVPTSVNRSTNDILAQATESIFSPTELSPPTLTQEAHIECSLSKDKELERHKDNNDIISAEKSHDLLSSITASVFSGTISTEDIYVEAITSHSTPENTVKDSSDSTNTKRFRPFTTEPTQGKRSKGNDDPKNSISPINSNNDDSISTNIITNNSPPSNSNAPSTLEKVSSSSKTNKSQGPIPSPLSINKPPCSNNNTSLSVNSLLSSQKDFNNSLDKIVSTEVMTSSSLMLTSNANDAYMNSREEHELPSLMLSSLTEDPSSLESGSNSGLPFLTLSPSEHFTSDLSSKDLTPAPSHHSFNFGSPHCEGISLSQKEDKQMESMEISQKKKDQTPSPGNSTPLFVTNSYNHPTVTSSQLTSKSNMLQQFSSSTVSSPHPPMYSVANNTICNQFQSTRASQSEESVKHESSRVSQNKVCPSVPSPNTLCYNSSPLSRPPRHTPEHAEHSPCYNTQNFVQLKSPRNHLKPNSPALDKSHHLENSPYIASSRSLEGSPSLSSYSAEALLSHQPNTTTLNIATKTSCAQIVTTYPSSTSFPRGEASLPRPSISYSAESLIQNQSCLDKKQQTFNYRPPLAPSYDDRSQQHQCPPPTFMDTTYSNHFVRSNQPAPPAPNNGHFVSQPLESCRPPFSRPSCTFPPQPVTSAQGYSNLSFNFSNASPNSRVQQHHNTSRSNACLQNFAPVSETHQNGCLFPNQMPPPTPTFSDSILPHSNPNTKYDSNKASMISGNFSQPSQNNLMNNFFSSNYIPSSTSSATSQRYELGINSASGKLDQHSQNNLNKIPSPAKPSKSNSKKSKQQAPTDNTASINVPSLPFDNNRNNSAGLSYFPVPDLSGTSKHDSFGNPRYFSSSQRLPNDQSGRMGPAPHHHRPPHPPPPPPESYNQLFKPQAPDPSLKFQTTSFGMPAPSGSGGQPHVPNFNLSNIFQDIGGPDAIGFSPMKFPSSLTPQSSQVMETQAPQPRSGAYHPRYPPPAPFHSHTPSFGNMIPTLNFPPH